MRLNATTQTPVASRRDVRWLADREGTCRITQPQEIAATWRDPDAQASGFHPRSAAWLWRSRGADCKPAIRNLWSGAAEIRLPERGGMEVSRVGRDGVQGVLKIQEACVAVRALERSAVGPSGPDAGVFGKLSG